MVRQIKGQFKVKEPLLLKYHQEVKRKIKNFDEITLENVFREQNTRADALSKLENDKRPNYSIVCHFLYQPCFENEVF